MLFRSPNPYLHRAPAADSRRPADPTSRMGRAQWRMSHVRFLRVAPRGTARDFHWSGIQRVYCCYSSRPRTRTKLNRHCGGCKSLLRKLLGSKAAGNVLGAGAQSRSEVFHRIAHVYRTQIRAPAWANVKCSARERFRSLDTSPSEPISPPSFSWRARGAPSFSGVLRVS